MFSSSFTTPKEKIGVSATVLHKKHGTSRIRPEAEMLSKDISKTEFKIKIESEGPLTEVKDLFNWASSNA